VTYKKTFSLLLFLIISGITYGQNPSLDKGILNLEDYDLSVPISLEGEWAFYPHILSPTPWEEGEPIYLTLPSEWDEATGHHFDVGTYHLHIIPNGEKSLVALRIMENIQAFRFSRDGELLFKTGIVSNNNKEARPGMSIAPITFTMPQTEFDITFEVSNWHHRKSGLIEPIVLGSYYEIYKTYSWKAALDIIFIGMAFSFTFLYLSFFFRRRENRGALWFSLLCLSLCLRIGLTNTSQLELILGEGWTLINKKLEYLSFLTAVLMFIYYLETIQKQFRIRWFSYIVPIPVYFYALLILFTPMNVYSFLLPFFQYYTLLFVGYVIYFLYKGLKNPNEVSTRLRSECLFLIISLVYDILYYNNVIKVGPIAGYCLFIVIFLEGLFQIKVLSNLITNLEILTDKYRKSIEKINQGRMEIEQQNKQLNWLSLYDQLTGLPNRYNLSEVLKVAISRAERNQTKIAVLYMDVDDFKDINDEMGHNRGDELLRLLAERLKHTIRKTDSLFRMGGDQFALIYTDLANKEQLDNIIVKVKRSLTNPLQIRGESLNITMSMGSAFFPEDGSNMDILIKNAELAMYQAKKQGKGNFISYNESFNNIILSRISISNNMKKALKAGHYKLFYQAQIDCQNEELHGFEALIRWDDPVKGLILPNDFIPIAEENGFIAQLGQWTLEEACKQIKRWTAKGYRDFNISVNISAYQFGLDHFIFDFQEILEKSKIDPAYLKVELTETMLMANPHLARRKMEQLQEMGINIALDDFGTGYSSLSYLNIFPVNYLKIDRAFIKNVHADESNRKLTTSIISLGKNLDLTLIAEGVETDDEKNFIREQGCHIIQGYVYSKPVPASEAEDFFQAFVP
jgi:diguanylate cyclase (GGDEF)-like protein